MDARSQCFGPKPRALAAAVAGALVGGALVACSGASGSEAPDARSDNDHDASTGDENGGEAEVDAQPPDAGDDGADEVVLFHEDFDDLAGRYETGDSFGAWTVIAAVEDAVVARAADEDISAVAGENVFGFSEYESESGFGDSRLDRCEEFDPARALAFDYQVYADLDDGTPDDKFRVRVNPNFYVDLETCEADVAARETDQRLEHEGAWYNEDWDVGLFTAAVSAGEWAPMTEANDGIGEPMEISPERHPPGATAVRFSIRLRDRAFPEDDSRRLYVDDIRLVQPGS